MPGTGPRVKNWCFTLNNYTQENLDRLSTPIDGISYLIFGREIGSSGTPHLQGTVCFINRKRLTSVIAAIGQAHCTPTRHLTQSIEYCRKDGQVTEWGECPVEKEDKRSDLEEFKQSIQEGVTDRKQLRELHSSVCALYPKFVEDYIQDLREKVKVPVHPLRQWQADLNQILLHEPNPREIIFIIDTTGNQGKSWFARYYCDIHDNAQIIIPGKKADMAYTINQENRVFFLDCPRSKQGDFIQYDFLEELKNGYVFSGKYHSTIKTLKTPHVVVLMNELPEEGKLSEDRYKIINLI
jgi:hypothetical protein